MRYSLSQSQSWLAAAGLVLCVGSVASATPVSSVRFLDGNVLDVKGTVGTGSSTAYLAVDFNNGSSEAFQYKYDGALNGYGLLTAVAAATSLDDSDQYFASFAEHLIYYVTDGANTTDQYPALYYSPPAPGDVDLGTSSQGIVYEQSQFGADNINVTDGMILAFDNSYSAVPILPETSAVPEPAAVATGSVVMTCALLRRRRRSARA